MRSAMRSSILALAVTGTLASSAAAKDRPRADELSADVAWRWFETLYDVVKMEGTTPPAAARDYGIAAVALYEAVVPGSTSHRSLQGQLNGLSAMPRASRPPYHWPAVANAAVADVLRGLYPDLSDASRATINNLELALAGQYEKEVDRPEYERSVAFGQEVANAVLAWASTDGYALFDSCEYTVPVGPGHWVATAPLFEQPLQPCWGQIRPMVLSTGAECAPRVFPRYSSDPTSEFYANAFVVHQVGMTLTPEQKEIARYWADGPGTTGTPPGHSIALMSGFVQEDGMSLMQAAEGYARVGIAVHDAFIACWNTKYRHNLIRPVSYIQQFISRAWKPYLPTPNFPEYASGHSTQSGAAAVVLTDLLGERAFVDTTRSRHALEPRMADRSFATIQDAADEAAASRLYGGIHYPFGNRDGMQQGQCVGQAVVDRLAFSNSRSTASRTASAR
jgi:hypothetical protein